jgi:negative regulator of sigma E activity
MSVDHRLDDELQRAFKRELPSTDFTARVMERVAVEGAPRASWWKKLAMLLEPPKLRWVAIGVTASLLLAVGAMQYNRMKSAAVDDKVTVANSNPSADPNQKDAVNSAADHQAQATLKNTAAPSIKHVTSSSNHRRAIARRDSQELRAEGEAAKETLMLALSIASSTLNDAQKAVHDDGLKP